LSHEGADPTDFIPVSAAGGSRTTPPHEAILRSTVLSPTITTNSFEALASPDSPPASPDSSVRAAVDPRLAGASVRAANPTGATTPTHHDTSSRFLASFYATWPESEVFDDSSRRIWDILHLGFAQADSVYEALDDRQSTLQKSLDARQESLRKSTKTDFRHLESIVYRSTGKTEEAVAAALQRLDRADAALVTSLESLTNMKNHLVTTTKTVVAELTC
jgi:hypothetical protein